MNKMFYFKFIFIISSTVSNHRRASALPLNWTELNWAETADDDVEDADGGEGDGEWSRVQ